jgi:sigma-B regulation protein RsbU (phosphoserine phosphatase)
MTIQPPAHKPFRFVWFKIALAVGMSLGALLLVQSIGNYVFVLHRLMIEQMKRDAIRHVTYVERMARQSRVQEIGQLGAILDELREESSGRIAWVRLTGPEGKPLAVSGTPAGEPFTTAAQASLFDQRELPYRIAGSAQGDMIVVGLPFRFRPMGTAPSGPPPGPPPSEPKEPGGPRRFVLAEIAMPFEASAGAFWPLKRNLIVNISASLALLAAIGVMALRFGPYVRGKQLEQQFDLARGVQRDLLPPRDMPAPGLALAAECVPAWEVGGDFYDVIPAAGGKVIFVLGDVSGKGLPAALLLGLLHGGVYAWVSNPAGGSLEEGARNLNGLLCRKTSRERYSTMFWGCYDPAAASLTYVNAGHLPPFLVRRDGAAGPRIVRLEQGGPVLGLLPDSDYVQASVPVARGDLLVLYSDGLTEASNKNGEEYGEDRLREMIERHASAPPFQLRSAVLEDVERFLGGKPLTDDLTLVVARIEG